MKEKVSDRATTRKAAERVAQLVGPILRQKRLVLVNARFTNQGKRRILEVTIHKPSKTVSLDDCEKVSRALEKKLDKAASSKEGPVIDGAFVLQVQSPGIDRKLKTQKELKVFVGEKVEVLSKIPIDTIGTNFTGTLLEAEEGMVTISEPVAIETKKTKKSKKKKEKEVFSPVLTSVEEITLEFKSLTYIRLSPQMESEVLN